MFILLICVFSFNIMTGSDKDRTYRVTNLFIIMSTTFRFWESWLPDTRFLLWQPPFARQRVSFIPRTNVHYLLFLDNVVPFLWLIYGGNITCFNSQYLVVNILKTISLVDDSRSLATFLAKTISDWIHCIITLLINSTKFKMFYLN